MLIMLFGAAGQAAEDFPPPIGEPSNATALAHPAAATPQAPGQPEHGAANGSSAAQEPAPKPERDVQIEQKHIGWRVSEIIVTPAGFTYHYTMDHLDDQDPGTPLQPHPQLSVPHFFRIDF